MTLGRKRLPDHQPELITKLEALIEPTVRGNPQSALRWTTLSVRTLEEALKNAGVSVSYRTVANLLKKLNYTLQGQFKRSEGKVDHQNRDAQFRYINDQAVAELHGRRPVVSVDTKKKELVGHYKNAGWEGRPKGDPIEVLTHDFPDPEVPKAVPYGVYDIGENKGWVNVWMSGDTAEFAVQSIREWWRYMGKPRYPRARRLLICADSGGSNGYRCHLWKRELHRLATEEKLTITVCHFPPGTSKWNKIAQRLFSFITANWRRRSLTDYHSESHCRDGDEDWAGCQSSLGPQRVQTRDQGIEEGNEIAQSHASCLSWRMELHDCTPTAAGVTAQVIISHSLSTRARCAQSLLCLSEPRASCTGMYG